MFNTRSVVFNLILINVVVFLLTILIGPKMDEWFGLFYPASPYFKPVQIITHMFMHGGFLHIFFNMFALWMFGMVLERVWGPRRFLIFYFVTGLGAVALHTGVQAWIVHNFTGSFNPSAEMVNSYPQVAALYGSPTIGASGAIFGILVAFGVLFPNTEMLLLFFPIPIKAKYFVTIYVVLELYNGIAMNPGDNVAHFAHLGGALFGFILVKIWNRDRHTLY
jgi:membrane associated rhomboid family serine protease